jgi:thiol-disulfide isomerase/thioredoxin
MMTISKILNTISSNSRFVMFLHFIIAASAYAQNNQTLSLNIGDPAPPLHVREWLKGETVEKFEKGKVYVVEFWATWCGPCIAAIPRLSKLARKYKSKAVFIGVDVNEQRVSSAWQENIKRVKAFVDSMGHRMNYRVAIEDSNFMESGWLDASWERYIPTAFVVNADGRVAWIGHPPLLHKILPDIINNKWNINEASAARNSNKHLEKLDDSLYITLMKYRANSKNPNGQPDSILLLIDSAVGKEPQLKFAPSIAYYTFSALLVTEPEKAYEYGKRVLATSSYGPPAYNSIIDVIEWYLDKMTLPHKIYELGADAYQGKINIFSYRELLEQHNLFKYYNKMAEWYWRAGDKSKAIYAEKKATKALKKIRPSYDQNG